jgi:hypothetical protein
VHAPTEDKDDVIKDNFHKELEQVFDQFPRYHMKILLGDINAKGGRDIFKPVIGNENLHEASNDNGARHFHIVTFINTLGLLLIVSHTIRSCLDRQKMTFKYFRCLIL